MAENNDERLNEQLLKSSVAKNFEVSEDLVQIKDWSATSGSADGDNFSCDLIAVKGSALVNGKPETFSYMCKVEPAEEMRKQMMKKMEVFDKEVFMYGEMLPMLNKTRGDHGLQPIPAPKCYFASSNPDILVMENIKDSGFSLIKNKETGMDESELIKLLEALGSFHASTAHMLAEFPGRNEAFLEKHPSFGKMKELDQEFMDVVKASNDSIFSNFVAVAEEYFGSEEVQRLKAHKSNCFERFIEIFLEPKADYQLIIHGDAWYNNAMFIYDSEGKTKTVKLLDFQVSRMTTPALDVCHCITTGTNYSTRKPNLDKWQSVYYDKFASDLKVLGLEADQIISLDHFKEHYNDMYAITFAFSFWHSKILLKKDEHFDVVDIKNAANFEEMANVNDKIKLSSTNQIKTNEPYREKVLGLLQEALDRNLI